MGLAMTKDKNSLPASSQEHSETSAKTAELETVLANFVKSFEASANRWENTIYPFIGSFKKSTRRRERMIYPAIIIFGIMASSGFWLIYSLTDDVHKLAKNVDPKMERNLALMAENISRLTKSVETMTDEVKYLRTHVGTMDGSMFNMQKDMQAISFKLDTLPPLLKSVSEMNQSIKYMTVNTGSMSYDMRGMNDNIGPPMSFMNTFIPW